MNKPPKNVEGKVINGPEDVMKEGLRSIVVTSRGPSIMDMWLTEGDPRGKERIVLYINGREAANVEFEVQ